MTNEVKTLREQLKDIIGKLPTKKQKEIEDFITFALSNSRVMLLEDLHDEGYITKSVGVKYIGREVDYINGLKK